MQLTEVSRLTLQFAIKEKAGAKEEQSPVL